MLFETKYACTLRPLLIHALSLVVVGGDGHLGKRFAGASGERGKRGTLL
jgi:hypothetical protein